MRIELLYILVAVAVMPWGVAYAEETDARYADLNRAFLEHVKALPGEHTRAAELVVRCWDDYRETMPESFVPEALALLYPTYRDTLAAYDEHRYSEARRLLEPLRTHTDPYLAANAGYFHARALIEQGWLEEAEHDLQELAESGRELADYTPYAAHFWFIRAYCEASNLRFEQAARTLRSLRENFPDAPEPVQVGARQLLLEIERREHGTLAEAAAVMSYSAARLKVADTGQRLCGRQEEIVSLLDKLIGDAERQEQQHSGGRQRSARPRRPRSGAEESILPESESGRVGQQHQASQANPGEMWGRLPPAEREKILQSLRERFPSRYRQLVEQYYRAMGEE